MPERESAPAFTNCHPRKAPIFRADAGPWTYLYAPGMPVRLPRAQADRLVGLLGKSGGEVRESPWGLAAESLERAADRAVDRYNSIALADFSPLCLTVILSLNCRLACSYCFVGSPKSRGGFPDDEAFLRAARLVARNCRRRGKEFVLVFHGGGEPARHMGRLKRFHGLARSIAREADVEFYSYIATSGVMSEADAAWLGRHFSSVGLSCDGPPAIQDRQRPLEGGAPTSARVERTSRIIRDEGGRIVMRATITPASLEELGSIVRYGRERLGLTDIRAEPVYRQPERGFSPGSADRFVEKFLEVEALARGLGCSLSLSGARAREIHGPYCQIHRDVLQLNSDLSISACFLAMKEGDPRIIGRLGGGKASLSIKREALSGLSRTLAAVPAPCAGCVNKLHCVRDCPDRCPAENRSAETGLASGRMEREGFRCRIQRRLTEHWIIENALPAGSFESKDGGRRA